MYATLRVLVNSEAFISAWAYWIGLYKLTLLTHGHQQ